MHTAPISFKGLDFSEVSSADREKFIKKNFKELQELGTKHDIKLVSSEARMGYAAIDVYVRPLKNGLNFFQRLTRPSVIKTFLGSIEQPEKTSLVKYIEESIAELGKKVHK